MPGGHPPGKIALWGGAGGSSPGKICAAGREGKSAGSYRRSAVGQNVASPLALKLASLTGRELETKRTGGNQAISGNR